MGDIDKLCDSEVAEDLTTTNHGTLTMDTVFQFLQEHCSERPPSHGVDHMKRVHDQASAIWGEHPEKVSLIDVQITAALHDFADHKYDKDGQLQNKLIRFLVDNDVPNPYDYINTINGISFSKEKKGGKRWFEAVLEPYWVHVRDIVSDADKLEALGAEGGMRCMQYAEELGVETKAEQVKHLFQHMKDKLLTLRDEYIVTEAGKRLATMEQDALVQFAIDQALKVL